jgi:hypothetical protein
VGQYDLEREVGVCDQVGDGDQLAEDVGDRPLLGRLAARLGTALARRALDDPALRRDRVHQVHAMLAHELPQLATDAGEAGGLDLDDPVSAQDVDAEAVDLRLDLIARPAEPGLQRRVQVLFVERADGRGQLG